MDVIGMLSQLGGDVLGVATGLATSGNWETLIMALAAIILFGLFMSSLESIISSTMWSLLLFVVLGVLWGGYKASWDFSGPLEGTWNAFSGAGGAEPLTFYLFLCYFIVFGVCIAVVNVVKGMVAG